VTDYYAENQAFDGAANGTGYTMHGSQGPSGGWSVEEAYAAQILMPFWSSWAKNKYGKWVDILTLPHLMKCFLEPLFYELCARDTTVVPQTGFHVIQGDGAQRLVRQLPPSSTGYA